MIFKVVGNQRWAKRSGWVNSTTGVINLGGGKRTSGEARMHMWHLHYTGAQVAACSMVRMLTTASLIPPALPQKKGGENCLPCACAVPPGKWVLLQRLLPDVQPHHFLWKLWKKDGPCMLQKLGQSLKWKEKEETIICPSSSCLQWPILWWDIAHINCES